MNSSRQTDFIDADLHAPRIPRPDLQAEDAVTRNELGHLQAQRARLEDEVAGTARDLESLRQQQENLLKRKQSLESLRKRQGEYVEEKQELGQRIHQCLLLLDKEEVRVSQLQELYRHSRELFFRLETQLKELGEGGWDETHFDEELTRSADVVKGVRMEFKKGLARLDSLDWNSESDLPPDDEKTALQQMGFGFWLKVGIAIGLPIAVLCGLSALAVVWILTKPGFGP